MPFIVFDSPDGLECASPHAVLATDAVVQDTAYCIVLYFIVLYCIVSIHLGL